MYRTLLILMLALHGLCPVTSAAQTAGETRSAALIAIDSGNITLRRAGYAALGDVGLAADVPRLLSALRDDDSETRTIAEQSIWRLWTRSGRAEVDRLFEQGVEQTEGGALAEALKTFSRVIEMDPGFAEAWNRRAMVYFLLGDYLRSLADCAEAVKRNLQHFGVLSGYGQIYLKTGEYDLALEYFQRALDINPNTDKVRAMVDRLERLLEELRQRFI